MNPERERFLNLREKPARLTAEEASHYLRCTPHDVPILVANGLLKPLGHPADNATKFFATSTVKELCEDVRWLARATDTIMQHWRMKNARKSENTSQFSTSPSAASSGTSALQRA